MEKLKISLLQLLPTESADDNLKKGINACRKAKAMGFVYLPKLESSRENEVHGNAYRRPEKYSLLLSEKIKYPFVREDRRN